MLPRPFRVLAIETSCDDTAVAVVASCRRIMSNVVVQQHVQHRPYGGIVPRLAAQLHRQRLPAAIQQCLDEAGFARLHGNVHGVAATRGPGLGPCLSVGFEAGRCIAAASGLPFYAVHHMEGHALTPRLASPDLEFPFLALLISGGHTLLLVVRGAGDYTILGRTLDDSVGEALDKASRMLGLPFIEGTSPAASLERAAALAGEAGAAELEPLPLPLKGDASLDFSFAGLKTALKNRLGAERAPGSLAHEFQRAVTAHLEDRLQRALQLVDMPRVVISGGVAQNAFIRARLTTLVETRGRQVFFAPVGLCSDNAAMIAWAAIESIASGKPPLDPTVLTAVRPEWPLDELKL